MLAPVYDPRKNNIKDQGFSVLLHNPYYRIRHSIHTFYTFIHIQKRYTAFAEPNPLYSTLTMYNVLLLSVSLLSAVHLTTGAPADLPIAPGNPNYGPANVPLTVTASGATPSETAAPVAEPQQSPVKEVKLSTSKKGVKLGDQEAVKVIETLQDHCGDIDCDQTPYTINARYPDSGGNGLTDGTITVEIQQSSFPSGSVGDLIQALKTFATEASEKTEATYVAGNNCLYSDKLGGRPCDREQP